MLVTQLQSSLLIVFYLDDGIICGDDKDIVMDLELVEQLTCELGLQLNHSKSEVIVQKDNANKVLQSP